MRNTGILIVAGFALLGCATPYQEMTGFGGVRAVRISDDTAQVTASGNVYTDPDTVQRYALRRAAEETLADGFDLFKIVDTTDRTRIGVATTAFAGANRGWASGFGYSSAIIRPGQTIMIKMLKGPIAASDPMPDGEYNAHEVEKYLSQVDASSDHKACAPDATGRVICQ